MPCGKALWSACIGRHVVREQFDYARATREGIADRVTLLLCDYASVTRIFDKMASIAMFEHVGLANHSAYFTTANRLLNPGGLYLHHSIARPAKRTDRQFRRRKGEYAALVRYIFPGSELDHVGMSLANLQRHGFEVHGVEAWREHYARTCRLWHDRLLARIDEATALVGAVKARLWLAYPNRLHAEHGGYLPDCYIPSDARSCCASADTSGFLRTDDSKSIPGQT